MGPGPQNDLTFVSDHDLLDRIACNAGQVHAISWPGAVGQVASQVRATGGVDEAVLVNHDMLRKDFLLTKGWPSVLVRVGLEVGHGPVHRRLEERHSTGRVVEGSGPRKLVEQCDVRGLVQELRLRVHLGAVVAADGFRKAL